jgi:putative oxidoreductase
VAAVVIELDGGLPLIAGLQARLIAIVLALLCLAAAVSLHNNLADQIRFLKNIMQAGGLLQIAVITRDGFDIAVCYSRHVMPHGLDADSSRPGAMRAPS